MGDTVGYGSYTFPAGTSAVIENPIDRGPRGNLLGSPSSAGREVWTVSGHLAAAASYSAQQSARTSMLAALATDGQALKLKSSDGGTIAEMGEYQSDGNGPYITSVNYATPVAVWGTEFTIVFSNFLDGASTNLEGLEKLAGGSTFSQSIEHDENGLARTTYTGSFVGTRSADYALLKQHVRTLVFSKIGEAPIQSANFTVDRFGQKLDFSIVTLESSEREILESSESFTINRQHNIVKKRKPSGGAALRYQHGDPIITLSHNIRQSARTGFPVPLGPIAAFAQLLDSSSKSFDEIQRGASGRAISYPITESYQYEIPLSREPSIDSEIALRLERIALVFGDGDVSDSTVETERLLDLIEEN